MPNTVHSDNILIEKSRNEYMPGWGKELCYRTLSNESDLSEGDIQQIYDIFVANGNAISPEPGIVAENDIRLHILRHVQGVNSLKKDQTITFCEEGMTLIFGRNGSGKSGYFRILQHVSGNKHSREVLQNVFEAHPDNPKCELVYSLDDIVQPLISWENKECQRGKEPLNRISTFDSASASIYVKRHEPDTYILRNEGYFLTGRFKRNLDALRAKVRQEIPELEESLNNAILDSIAIGNIYKTYIDTLKVYFEEEVKNLLNKKLKVSVSYDIDDHETPVLSVILDNVYEVDDVFSEGELKCISLALFLAEQRMKPKSSPVVFDDPVNSLDNAIIEKFAERIIKIDRQVILFTHNVWLLDLITKSNNVKWYSVTVPKAQRINAKTHLFVFETLARREEKGIIEEYKAPDAKSFLDKARSILDDPNFGEPEKIEVGGLLRHSVECLVDDKVFLSLTPCRYRGTHINQILWEDMKDLASVPVATVETLKEQYGKLSGNNGHIGMAAMEHPLEYDELCDIYDELIALP